MYKFGVYVRLKSLFVYTHESVAVLLNLLSVLFEDSYIVSCGLSLLQVLDLLFSNYRFLKG
jgi:hypothetical protein